MRLQRGAGTEDQHSTLGARAGLLRSRTAGNASIACGTSVLNLVSSQQVAGAVCELQICCPCSEERARRISTARSERAEDYRWARLAQGARAQLEQRREAEAAAAEAGEEAAAELEKRPEVTLLIKADVQARS